MNESGLILFQFDTFLYVDTGTLEFKEAKKECKAIGMELANKIEQLEVIIDILATRDEQNNTDLWVDIKNRVLLDPKSGYNLKSTKIFIDFEQNLYYPMESEISNSWCVGTYSDALIELGIADGWKYSRTKFLYRAEDVEKLPKIFDQEIATDLDIDLESMDEFHEASRDRVYNGKEYDGFKYFMFRKSIEGGSSIQTVSTSLRLTSFEGVEDFCGDRAGCIPDPIDEENLKDQITNSTIQALPGRDISIEFKGWARGSVVCDYDIVETVPLSLITDTYVSPMDQFLTSVSVFDKFGVDKNFTEKFTQGKEKIECKDGYFLCDFADLRKSGVNMRKMSTCLADVLKCDGIVQCPSGFDEEGCLKQDLSTGLNLIKSEGDYILYDGFIWIASTDFGDDHYPGNINQRWNLKTSPGLAYLVTFIHFNTEYDRNTGSCADKLIFNIVNKGVVTFQYEFCGDMESASVPFVPPRSLPIYSLELAIEFNSDSFTAYDGFLIRIDVVPAVLIQAMLMTNDRETDNSVICDNRQLPINWKCDNEIDCSSGADEANCTVGSFPKRHQAWSSDGLQKKSFVYGDLEATSLIENDFESLVTTERAEKLGLGNDTFYCGKYSMNGNFECDGFVDCIYAEDEYSCDENYQEELVELAESNPIEIEEGVNMIIMNSSLISISSKNFPDNSPKDFRSIFYLSGPANSIFLIYPIYFYLPSVTGCLSNRLDIHDGNDLSANLVGSFCSLPSKIPKKIVSSSNQIILNFKSDFGDPGKFLLLIKNIDISGSPDTHNNFTCESWPVEYIRAYPNLFIDSKDSSCKSFTGDDYCFQNGKLNLCAHSVLESFSCLPTTFQCPSNTQCLPFTKLCDLVPDCPDGADEESCQFNSEAFQTASIVDSNLGLKTFTPDVPRDDFILLSFHDFSKKSSGVKFDFEGTNVTLDRNLLFMSKNISSIDVISSNLSDIQERHIFWLIISSSKSRIVSHSKMLSVDESFSVVDDVFTNSLSDDIINYESDKTYLYSLSRATSFTLTVHRFSIEAAKSFRSGSVTCIDQLLVYDDGILVSIICGEGEDVEVEITTGKASILLLSDKPGKYDLRNNNPDKFVSFALKNELKCCAADCASKIKCDCPNDTGYFVASVATKQIKKRFFLASPFQNMDLVNCTRGFPAEGWTKWMSAVVPSGIQLAGVYVSGGENESTLNLRNSFDFCASSKIINVECRAKTGKPMHSSVDCSKAGVFCQNRNLAGELCDDHEIRFFCVCNQASIFDNSTSCSPGWDAPKTTSLAKLATVAIEAKVEFLRGIECINQAGTELSAVDQTGFNPSFSCDLANGYKCNQKAPCHPCPSVQVKLWKSCSADANYTFIENNTVTSTTEAAPVFVDSKKCVSFSGARMTLGNISTTICDGNW